MIPDWRREDFGYKLFDIGIFEARFYIWTYILIFARISCLILTLVLSWDEPIREVRKVRFSLVNSLMRISVSIVVFGNFLAKSSVPN